MLGACVRGRRFGLSRFRTVVAGNTRAQRATRGHNWKGKSMSYRASWLAGCFALTCVAAARAESVRYDCRFDPARSGLSAHIGLHVGTAGALHGNWDELNNPEGTRTKPGLFGGFGDDENLPVDVSFDFDLGGRVDSATAGAFRLRVKPDRNLIRMADLDADLLAGGPVTLPAEVTLLTDNFRTRQPDSLYFGDIPITLPLGEISLTALRITQTEERVVGSLTPIEGNRFSFIIVPIVNLSGQFTALENTFDLPPTPMPLPLTGEIEIGPIFVHLVSIQPIDLSQSQPLDLELPEFPLDLPTILPPGDTAHLLMNLLLSEVGSVFQGELRAEADGVIHNP